MPASTDPSERDRDAATAGSAGPTAKGHDAAPEERGTIDAQTGSVPPPGPEPLDPDDESDLPRSPEPFSTNDSAGAHHGSHTSGGTEPGPAGLPAIPPSRGGLAHVVVPVTVIWFIAFIVLLFFIDDLRAHGAMVWLWTTLAGWVLGLIGLSIYAWQRSAARRGTKTSSQMSLQEKL